MAAASPHKKMMMLSLRQLEGNLINFERDRVNLITAIPFGPRTPDELPFEVLLREADQCCKEQGEILLYITRLTLTPGYYERPHRTQRLLYLLDSLMHCVDTVIDAAERLPVDESIEEWPTNQKFFIMARRMLSTGRDMIKIQHTSRTSEVPKDNANSGSNASSVDSFTTSADGGMINKIEYFHRPSPYTWASSAEYALSRPYYSKVGLPEPFIERSKAAYSIKWTSSRSLWEAPFLKDDFDCSSFNSVWLSSMTDHVFEKDNQTDYFRILSTILSLSTDKSSYLYDLDGRNSSFQHPLTLAQGLRNLRVDVGYIFADDPSVIIWPLGKNTATAKANVVIHCTRTCTVSNAWRYKALRPCESGNVGQNERLVGETSSICRTLLQPDTAVHNYGLLSASEANYKGRNFFDLPAELRNVIYTECVEDPCTEFSPLNLENICSGHEHYGDNRSQHLSWLDPTALCRSSRRIRDEILPLLLADRYFKVDLLLGPRKHKKSTWSSIDTHLLTAHNKWLAQCPNTAYLKTVELSARASKKPGFTVSIRLPLKDVSSGYNLTSVRGCFWRPETVPGGYNLSALIRIIVLDKETVGLSMADVACIAEFLGQNYKRWTRRR
ncbi:hypothetical protein NU219Hw_g9097t1 [Hortaea werneckii]